MVFIQFKTQCPLNANDSENFVWQNPDPQELPLSQFLIISAHSCNAGDTFFPARENASPDDECPVTVAFLNSVVIAKVLLVSIVFTLS